jgi:hypothetical protein
MKLRGYCIPFSVTNENYFEVISSVYMENTRSKHVSISGLLY